MIALKPMPASNAVLKPLVVWPSTWYAPAKPTNTPETTIATIVMRRTSMPAVRAAEGFSPTARSLKPRLDRSSR